jgi:Zn-dependent metalloprotease
MNPLNSVGTGTGVLGDVKKISTTLLGDGLYYANDILRPPALYTLDLRGNVYRYIAWLNGQVHVQQSDFGTDADNVWTDPALVDAHVYLGWTYDYFYKVHGRKGLDDKNVDLMAIVHAVHRSDLERYVDSGLIDDLSDLYVNAFYLSPGLFTFGEGLPGGWTYGGQSYNYMAGELGIVAHEYTHGVSDYASHLDYEGEPRSLDEAFSDMMGVSVDYYYKPGTANYVVGEEVVSGGFRSLSNPAAYGGIDHYSKRRPWLGYEYDNMSIASHAFYLAIEGGTNRTSGLAVPGVGAANRQLIEKCFYRGFTSLTSQATFGLARRRTIESAQVLYGSGSAAERAITQAWNAVGVQ